MKHASKILLLITGLGLLAPALADKDPNVKAIKARQGEMQLRSFNAGPLFGMAKGDIEYDAEAASKFANNLKLLLDLDNGRAWAPQSHAGNYKGETTALAKIWETYPEIAEYGKKYSEAVMGLAADAGKGRDALKPRVAALGKSCKGCHDEFREKQ